MPSCRDWSLNTDTNCGNIFSLPPNLIPWVYFKFFRKKLFFYRLKNIPKASGLGGRVKIFSQIAYVLSDQSLQLGIFCGLPPHPNWWLKHEDIDKLHFCSILLVFWSICQFFVYIFNFLFSHFAVFTMFLHGGGIDNYLLF